MVRIETSEPTVQVKTLTYGQLRIGSVVVVSSWDDCELPRVIAEGEVRVAIQAKVRVLVGSPLST